jgi:hypothetical protein
MLCFSPIQRECNKNSNALCWFKSFLLSFQLFSAKTFVSANRRSDLGSLFDVNRHRYLICLITHRDTEH